MKRIKNIVKAGLSLLVIFSLQLLTSGVAFAESSQGPIRPNPIIFIGLFAIFGVLGYYFIKEKTNIRIK